jgi:hypothetical protein
MGGTSSTYGVDVWCIQVFGWKNLRESGYLKDLGVDGRIILKKDLQAVV